MSDIPGNPDGVDEPDNRAAGAPSDPRIPRTLLGHSEATSEPAMTTATVDPLGWCVIATTALVAWLVGPLAVAGFGAIGFVRYWRAWRSGRTDSQCILGDVRLVLAYLAVITVGAAIVAVVGFTTP